LHYSVKAKKAKWIPENQVGGSTPPENEL
jgi:hypothetical protein